MPMDRETECRATSLSPLSSQCSRSSFSPYPSPEYWDISDGVQTPLPFSYLQRPEYPVSCHDSTPKLSLSSEAARWLREARYISRLGSGKHSTGKSSPHSDPFNTTITSPYPSTTEDPSRSSPSPLTHPKDSSPDSTTSRLSLGMRRSLESLRMGLLDPGPLHRTSKLNLSQSTAEYYQKQRRKKVITEYPSPITTTTNQGATATTALTPDRRSLGHVRMTQNQINQLGEDLETLDQVSFKKVLNLVQDFQAANKARNLVLSYPHAQISPEVLNLKPLNGRSHLMLLAEAADRSLKILRNSVMSWPLVTNQQVHKQRMALETTLLEANRQLSAILHLEGGTNEPQDRPTHVKL